MKKLLTLIAVLFAGVAFGQAPEKEYTLALSENTITLKPGETKQVTVTLNRSKYFTKAQAQLGISSTLPAGISINYEPAKGSFTSSVATITATSDVKAGEYSIILKSTLKNLNKGSILKIVVESGVPKNAVTAN